MNWADVDENVFGFVEHIKSCGSYLKGDMWRTSGVGQ